MNKRKHKSQKHEYKYTRARISKEEESYVFYF
jgi:hypothetical protein